MAKIPPRLRSSLVSQAHTLKPLLHVGKDGLTETAIAALNSMLATRELGKIRVLEAAPLSTREAATQLETGIPGLQVIQIVGRVLTIHRPASAGRPPSAAPSSVP